MPDLSYASPALDMVSEDKSGMALAWVFLPSCSLCGGSAPGHRHRKEPTMSHDKIKAAARRRMAATGEPYAAARRQAISEYSADPVTSAVSAEDIHAAAQVHRELGPDYSDAVVASFLDKVDRAVAARVEARLADRAQSQSAQPARRGRRLLSRRVTRDVLAAGAGALVVVGAIGLHGITSAHPSPPASKLGNGTCAAAGAFYRCPVITVQSDVTGGGTIIFLAPGPGSIPR